MDVEGLERRVRSNIEGWWGLPAVLRTPRLAQRQLSNSGRATISVSRSRVGRPVRGSGCPKRRLHSESTTVDEGCDRALVPIVKFGVDGGMQVVRVGSPLRVDVEHRETVKAELDGKSTAVDSPRQLGQGKRLTH